jgi:hypothetical protein
MRFGAMTCFRLDESARHVPRDLEEDARDLARRLMGTKRFLIGLSGARDEFHLAAIVQNLKTLALRSIGPPVAPQFASRA